MEYIERTIIGVVVHQARTSALQAEGSGFETHLLHSDFHCFHNVNGLARGSNLAIGDIAQLVSASDC